MSMVIFVLCFVAAVFVIICIALVISEARRDDDDGKDWLSHHFDWRW